MLSTIDLFAGAGGITEGFRQAGYQCLYANDSNTFAAETFRHNHPTSLVEASPIEEVDASSVRRGLGLLPGELSLLAGGPPCQGFSINAPERFLEDPRNSLFHHYIRFLKEFRPQLLLFENVPGMLSLFGGLIFQEIMRQFSMAGYHVAAKILQSAHYGVPQERWRLIVIGSRKSPAPEHPLPTHYASLRTNFRGGKSMTFRLGPLDQALLRPAVTVADAISDLPPLSSGEGSEVTEYCQEPTSDFALSMRELSPDVNNHIASRLSSRNLARLRHIPPGGSWRDIPYDLLPKGMQRARKSDHTKRYGRLLPEGLAGTLMTKCDPHWGAVFLPDQDRCLTVREAARLQSFRDIYHFRGPLTAQYEQIGNAVPPLMANAIAEVIRSRLRDETS